MLPKHRIITVCDLNFWVIFLEFYSASCKQEGFKPFKTLQEKKSKISLLCEWVKIFNYLLPNDYSLLLPASPLGFCEMIWLVPQPRRKKQRFKSGCKKAANHSEYQQTTGGSSPFGFYTCFLWHFLWTEATTPQVPVVMDTHLVVKEVWRKHTAEAKHWQTGVLWKAVESNPHVIKAKGFASKSITGTLYLYCYLCGDINWAEALTGKRQKPS